MRDRLTRQIQLSGDDLVSPTKKAVIVKMNSVVSALILLTCACSTPDAYLTPSETASPGGVGLTWKYSVRMEVCSGGGFLEDETCSDEQLELRAAQVHGEAASLKELGDSNLTVLGESAGSASLEVQTRDYGRFSSTIQVRAVDEALLEVGKGALIDVDESYTPDSFAYLANSVLTFSQSHRYLNDAGFLSELRGDANTTISVNSTNAEIIDRGVHGSVLVNTGPVSGNALLETSTGAKLEIEIVQASQISHIDLVGYSPILGELLRGQTVSKSVRLLAKTADDRPILGSGTEEPLIVIDPPIAEWELTQVGSWYRLGLGRVAPGNAQMTIQWGDTIQEYEITEQL